MSSTSAASSPSTSLPDMLGKFSLLPHADVILRSSDPHDFRVQKFYVVDSSPIFGEQIMAATCHGIGPEAASEASCEATIVGSETKDNPLLPVVRLPESHAIISSLLTFVFTVSPALPPTIEQILELLSAAQKYEMTTTLIRIRDYASRRDPPSIYPETALQVYSLARKYGLLEETRLAAEGILKSPMTIQDFEDKFDIMPSAALYELWKYRQRVLKIVGVRLNTQFFESGESQILFDANLDCVDSNPETDIPLWLDQYLDSIQEDLACLDLTTFHLARSSHVSDTSTSSDRFEHCASISGENICEFWTALTATAESDFSLTEGEIRFQGCTSATTKASPLPEGLNMQGADVILRSFDLVSFRVHKLILAISSPFFSDTFSLSQPRDDDSEVFDDLQVPFVRVSADAEVLHSLLTRLYPIPSVILDSYENALTVLAAAQKYNMLIPEMEAAAWLTLDHPMTFEVIADALPLFNSLALSDLIHFRKRCRDYLLSLFEGFVEGSDDLSKIWCSCGKTKGPPLPPQSDKAILAGWLRDLFLRHTESLEQTYTNTLPKPSSLRKEIVAALRVAMRKQKGIFERPGASTSSENSAGTATVSVEARENTVEGPVSRV
ncbi:hypothetical protein BJY52DRAFT_1215423, partial [Lactarius psammicola]